MTSSIAAAIVRKTLVSCSIPIGSIRRRCVSDQRRNPSRPTAAVLTIIAPEHSGNRDRYRRRQECRPMRSLRSRYQLRLVEACTRTCTSPSRSSPQKFPELPRKPGTTTPLTEDYEAAFQPPTLRSRWPLSDLKAESACDGERGAETNC